jgi:hypothetical protein
VNVLRVHYEQTVRRHRALPRPAPPRTRTPAPPVSPASARAACRSTGAYTRPIFGST